MVIEMETNKGNDFRPVRCSRCGWFLGYEGITGGGVVLRCTKCKNWTVVKAAGDLTRVEEADIIKSKG